MKSTPRGRILAVVEEVIVFRSIGYLTINLLALCKLYVANIEGCLGSMVTVKGTVSPFPEPLSL